MSRYIDVDAVISGVKNRCIGQNDVVKVEHSIISMLYMMPTIEAESVRHGKWIGTEDKDEQYGYVYKCSVCGTSTIGDSERFCGWCGARMDEE